MDVGSIKINLELDTTDYNQKLDEATKNAEEFSQKVSSSTEGVTTNFKQSTESLLALGNVAQSVNNIFESYQNTQIRIENAELRVIEARQDLNRLTEEGRAGTLEYESAVRRLTIAENNLERSSGDMIGTSINMGVQILTISNSLPKIIEGFSVLNTTTKAASMAMTGFVGALPAIGVLTAVAGGILAIAAAQQKVNEAEAESGKNRTPETEIPTTTPYEYRDKTLYPQNERSPFSIIEMDKYIRGIEDEKYKAALESVNKIMILEEEKNQLIEKNALNSIEGLREYDQAQSAQIKEMQSAYGAVGKVLADAMISEAKKATDEIEDMFDRFGSSGTDYAIFVSKRNQQIKEGLILPGKTY